MSCGSCSSGSCRLLSGPQGGGRRRYGDREVLAAIIFVATSGCTWRQLPRRSGRRVQRPTGGSPNGARPGCGPSSTAWFWMNSVPAASSTGPGARLTRWTCGP
ncbi:transposase [Streptomyces sp. QHH-9511]|uniref:transposase n=1 Tax=Streptomyces sp. QHH-9511 TaxID=2684468 RepID=UPI002FCD268D